MLSTESLGQELTPSLQQRLEYLRSSQTTQSESATARPTLTQPLNNQPTLRAGSARSSFAPGTAGNAPPWGSQCAMEINKCISRRQGTFFNECMVGCTKNIDWRRLRWSLAGYSQCLVRCVTWSKTYQNFPPVTSCNLEQVCQVPLEYRIDEWLSIISTPADPRNLNRASFTQACLCEQYWQTQKNKDGKSATGCSAEDVQEELSRYIHQCRRPTEDRCKNRCPGDSKCKNCNGEYTCVDNDRCP